MVSGSERASRSPPLGIHQHEKPAAETCGGGDQEQPVGSAGRQLQPAEERRDGQAKERHRERVVLDLADGADGFHGAESIRFRIGGKGLDQAAFTASRTLSDGPLRSMRLPYLRCMAASTAARSSVAMVCRDTVVGQSMRTTFSAISSIVIGTSHPHKPNRGGGRQTGAVDGCGQKKTASAGFGGWMLKPFKPADKSAVGLRSC